MRFLLYFVLNGAENSFGGLREYLLQRPEWASLLEQIGKHWDKERPFFGSVRLETRLRGEHDQETFRDVSLVQERQELPFSPTHLEEDDDVLSLQGGVGVDCADNILDW